MSLDFLHVNYNFPDAVKLNEIMLRQFPPEEQMPLDEQLELQAKGEVELWAFYDNKELIGFGYASNNAGNDISVFSRV